MFCPQCGAQLSDNAKYCHFCGEKVSGLRGTYSADTTIREMFLKSSGRLNRLRYFKRSIVVGIFKVLTLIALMELFQLFNVRLVNVLLIVIVVYTVFLVPFYFLYVRRLQDLNRGSAIAIARSISGFILMLLRADSDEATALSGIVALITLYMELYLLFADGTHGTNDYGPDPLGRN